MNEMMKVYLDLEGKTRYERKRIIQRMDSFLLEYGVKYGGESNLYVPMVARERDDVLYTAGKALAECEWLKGLHAHIRILDKTEVCRLDEVQIQHMTEPSKARYVYYERYYMETGKLPHGILVDENRFLKEGYVAYLLARRYGAKADIREVLAIQPYRKSVTGRHVSRTGGGFRCHGMRRYTWIYDLREPVVPGDVLMVETDGKSQFMCVDSVGYLTGRGPCGEHKRTKEHMHRRMRNTEEAYGMERKVEEKDEQGAGKE